jgi:hypothetical protein
MSDSRTTPPERSRLIAFSAFTACVCLTVAGYVAWRYQQHTTPSTQTAPDANLGTPTFSELRREPHLFMRSAKRDQYGRILAAGLDQPDTQRAASQLTCERFAFARERGICVQDNRINLTPPAKALIVDADLAVVHSVDLAGVPSRARISADGRYAVATVFTAGDDYESEFSTRTTLIDTSNGKLIADLEQLRVLQDDRVISEVDFNFWGVTFKRDSNQFFATLGTKGKTYLVEGDINARQMRVLRQNVECPSLSPDEKRLVFKSRVPGARGWRLHALELASNTEWTLQAETRSVDDQVEWLDNEHVLYRILEDRGLPEDALNIWTIAVTPGNTEAPRIFGHGASTPSVQR